MTNQQMHLSVGLAMLSINKDKWMRIKVEGARSDSKYYDP